MKSEVRMFLTRHLPCSAAADDEADPLYGRRKIER
jgi:hypothetical protein